MTDIAKYRNDNDPRFVIQNWMRNRYTVEFLAVWEELHNSNFNRVQFEAVKENLMPAELTPEQIAYTYASEADLLNVALFGQRKTRIA